MLHSSKTHLSFQNHVRIFNKDSEYVIMHSVLQQDDCLSPISACTLFMKPEQLSYLKIKPTVGLSMLIFCH